MNPFLNQIFVFLLTCLLFPSCSFDREKSAAEDFVSRYLKDIHDGNYESLVNYDYEVGGNLDLTDFEAPRRLHLFENTFGKLKNKKVEKLRVDRHEIVDFVAHVFFEGNILMVIYFNKNSGKFVIKDFQFE